MRPYQTIALLVVILAVAVYFYTREEQPDPRIEQFINCYIDLSVLHYTPDVDSVMYSTKVDSVLASHGYNRESFAQLKRELDKNPDQMIDIWQQIEQKLKKLKEQYDITTKKQP